MPLLLLLMVQQTATPDPGAGKVKGTTNSSLLGIYPLGWVYKSISHWVGCTRAYSYSAWSFVIIMRHQYQGRLCLLHEANTAAL